MGDIGGVVPRSFDGVRLCTRVARMPEATEGGRGGYPGPWVGWHWRADMEFSGVSWEVWISSG